MPHVLRHLIPQVCEGLLHRRLRYPHTDDPLEKLAACEDFVGDTPIVEADGKPQVIADATRWVRSYCLKTGIGPGMVQASLTTSWPARSCMA